MARKTITMKASEPGWYKYSFECEEGLVAGNIHLAAGQEHTIYFEMPASVKKRFDNIDMTIHPRKKRFEQRWESKRARQKNTQRQSGYKRTNAAGGNDGSVSGK